MKKINANLHRLPQVTVLGIPALITPHKVSRDTVHLGLFCYDLKGEESSLAYPLIMVSCMILLRTCFDVSSNIFSWRMP